MTPHEQLQHGADALVSKIREMENDPERQGAIIVLAANKLGMACTVFTDEELGEVGTDEVEDAMIVAGNTAING